MKKFFIMILIIISAQASAQVGSVAYREAKALIINNGYKIASEQYADLAQGESATYTKEFYKGNEYIIIGMSDDSDVNDVDIYLKSTDGEEYTKDADSSDVAVVRFEPSFSRSMRVVIKNYDSDTPTYESRCRILIGYK
ncbi:MAG: hypothetical protein LBD21_00785 [Tannerellaceae bacterium]|jgi:hypothetical protein|nr:hypothetical protein [Tannerellaceae bacterium]